MAHHIYHTHALVMRVHASGEADMTLELFTKDWGKITAHARGLRREASRLRYILQPMSWVLASVVRGKAGWRLTTANPEDTSLALHKNGASLARVSAIVQKFFPHEVASEAVFQSLLWHAQRLASDPTRRGDWEVLTLAKIFQHLGYWSLPKHEALTTALVPTELSKEEKTALVSEINRILRTVHT